MCHIPAAAEMPLLTASTIITSDESPGGCGGGGGSGFAGLSQEEGREGRRESDSASLLADLVQSLRWGDGILIQAASLRGFRAKGDGRAAGLNHWRGGGRGG